MTKRKHGQTGNKEYRAWGDMKARCIRKDHPKYPDYGGRGIRVCKRWLAGFSYFYRDLGPAPSPRYSIDRIDNEGDYVPGNVRWATPQEQALNRRTNHHIEIDGVTHTLSEWCVILDIRPNTYHKRLSLGWNVIDALTRPIS